MKKPICKNRWLQLALLVPSLTFLSHTLTAQNVVIGFDNDSVFTNVATSSWKWWGGAAVVREWTTNDANNNPNSGSIKLTVTWPTGSGADYQYAVGLPLSGGGNYDTSVKLTAINYTNMEFDLLWDTNSTMPIQNHMVGGDPNGFGFGYVATQYGQTWVPNANQPVLTNLGAWQHFSIPIDPTWPDIPGVIFKKWMPYNAANEGMVSAFWVDNIKFNYNTNLVVPKPTMTATPAVKGLGLTAAQSGQQYQREGALSIPASSVVWYGNPDPVTYSFTIADFPNGATYGGYQAHLFLAPDGSGAAEPDWNDSNVIFIQVQALSSGQGVCNFRFKTNSPASNGVGTTGYFGSGYLGQVVAPTVLGTWSATFSNNSICTITGPGGVSSTFDMGADAAAMFQSSFGVVNAYIGIQPNNPGNIGQRAVFSNFKVSNGSNVVVDDHFSVEDPFYEVDPNLWTQKLDGGVNCIKVVDSSPAYWLDWTLPDPFLSGIQISSNLLSGWIDSGLVPKLNGTRREAFVGLDISTNYQPNAFFRLFSTNSP
jgi:hypothetical protein